MPYIVTTVNYPSDKNNEVIKVFFDALQKHPPNPKFGEIVVQASPKRTLKGIKGMNIIKVKQGKLEDALALAEKQAAMFLDVQGYESEIEVWNTMEEALGNLGIEPPA